MSDSPKKRPPADDPPPEAARLMARPWHAFDRFSAGERVKVLTTVGWRSGAIHRLHPHAAEVILVGPKEQLSSAGDRQIVRCHDARNVLSNEEHKTYSLHRDRLKRLQKRREERRETERLLLLEQQAAATGTSN